MQTFEDAVEELTSAQAGGFDLRAPRPENLIQQAIKQLAADSHWIKAQPELGPTVDGQAQYALPERIVRLFAVMVNNELYHRRELQVLWELRSSATQLPANEEGGILAEAFAEDGSSKYFEIYPEPDEETKGRAITGLASIVPDDLSGSDELPFPPKYRRAIVDFAKSVAYEDTDENPQAGTYFLNRYTATAEQLRLFGNARVGSGPWKAPVAGHRRR